MYVIYKDGMYWDGEDFSCHDFRFALIYNGLQDATEESKQLLGSTVLTLTDEQSITMMSLIQD